MLTLDRDRVLSVLQVKRADVFAAAFAGTGGGTFDTSSPISGLSTIGLAGSAVRLPHRPISSEVGTL